MCQQELAEAVGADIAGALYDWYCTTVGHDGAVALMDQAGYVLLSAKGDLPEGFWKTWDETVQDKRTNGLRKRAIEA